jgi:hypothetical protein
VKRDRRSVRDFRRMISVNEYDVERINRLLDQIGGEEARIMYRCFKRGLDLLEQDIERNPKNKTRRLAACA